MAEFSVAKLFSTLGFGGRPTTTMVRREAIRPEDALAIDAVIREIDFWKMPSKQGHPIPDAQVFIITLDDVEGKREHRVERDGINPDPDFMKLWKELITAEHIVAGGRPKSGSWTPVRDPTREAAPANETPVKNGVGDFNLMKRMNGVTAADSGVTTLPPNFRFRWGSDIVFTETGKEKIAFLHGYLRVPVLTLSFGLRTVGPDIGNLSGSLGVAELADQKVNKIKKAGGDAGVVAAGDNAAGSTSNTSSGMVVGGGPDGGTPGGAGGAQGGGGSQAGSGGTRDGGFPGGGGKEVTDLDANVIVVPGLEGEVDWGPFHGKFKTTDPGGSVHIHHEKVK